MLSALTLSFLLLVFRSKGSSLDGPKVGIPLAVHAVALEVQRLSSQCIVGADATQAQVLGESDRDKQRHQRIVWTRSAPTNAGDSSSTPRVGLVQAATPVRWAGTKDENGDGEVIYWSGECRHVQVVHDYVRAYNSNTDNNKNQRLTVKDSSLRFHVLLHEQQYLSSIVLPFFQALCPPTRVFDSVPELYETSLTMVRRIYRDDGEVAAKRIGALATVIRTGGARVHEQVLQDGILHALATWLRLGLQRAHKLGIIGSSDSVADAKLSMDEWRTKYAPVIAAEEGSPSQSVTAVVSPPFVPPRIVNAILDLFHACCGPASPSLASLSPSWQIHKTSDLALTALFGLALDWDLWTPNAATAVLTAVADTYRGVTAGYLGRSQVSVQHVLDAAARVVIGPAQAVAVARIVGTLLVSSLQNKRSIAQSEHDVAACVAALTATSVNGSTRPVNAIGTANVVLLALVSLLVACDVVPVQALGEEAAFVKLALSDELHMTTNDDDDEAKKQVAIRLARSLLMSRFPEVVAPMLLSRTASAKKRSPSTAIDSNEASESNDASEVTWQSNWRLILVLFTWITSISGPEGHQASETCGTLILASALAGTLQDAMVNMPFVVVTSLILPPPGSALQIQMNGGGSEFRYSDVLADRVLVVLPLIPGLTVSLMQSSDQEAGLAMASHVLTAVGGALTRVYSTVSPVVSPVTLLIHLVRLARVLETHCELSESADGPVELVPTFSSSCSWIRLHDAKTETPRGENEMTRIFNMVLYTAADLMVAVFDNQDDSSIRSMKEVWQLVSKAINGVVRRGSAFDDDDSDEDDDDDDEIDLKSNDGSNDGLAHVGSDDFLTRTRVRPSRIPAVLVTRVLKHALDTYDDWVTWVAARASAALKWLEKQPVFLTVDSDLILKEYHNIQLVGVMLQLLQKGREATGWCQLALPSMPGMAPTVAPRWLPILRPCLRTIWTVLPRVSIETSVLAVEDNLDEKIEQGNEEVDRESLKTVLFLAKILTEVDATITAATVGLSFATSRDTALHALATLRTILSNADEQTKPLLQGLFHKITDELRARYDSERRLRESAILDNYSGGTEEAVAEAQNTANTIERLLVGGEDSMRGSVALRDDEQQITFLSGGETTDQALFPEQESESAIMAVCDYQGLASVLVSNVEASTLSEQTDGWLERLGPYLTRWDKRQLMTERGGEATETLTDLDDDPLLWAEPASEAMSTFIDMATAEASRTRVGAGLRYSRLAFSERLGWTHVRTLLEAFNGGHIVEDWWERAIADGNRDIRSRIATVPTVPQFRRYIPGYLDHGAVVDKPVSDAKPEEDMNAITKTLLEVGDFEIVDITKKEMVDDDFQLENLLDKSKLQDDEGEFSTVEGGNLDEPGTEEGTTATEPLSNTPGDNSVAPSTTIGHTEGDDDEDIFATGFGSQAQPTLTTSSFATPPDNATSSFSLLHSAAAKLIESYFDNCWHVKPEGNRSCMLLLTATHLILEYEAGGALDGEVLAAQEDAERLRLLEQDGASLRSVESAEEVMIHKKGARRQRHVASLRPQSLRYNLSEVSHVYLRRYRLRDSSLEIFFIPSGGTSYGGFGLSAATCSVMLDFGTESRRDEVAFSVMRRSPPQALRQWPDRSLQFLHEQLSRLTVGWAEGRLTNFDYLLHLNLLSGRTYNDICQYPVFPWVLSDYHSEKIPDLTNRANFRDLSKPVGALNPDRLKDFLERFETFADPTIPPFLYGSHYSTSAGVVLHFLVRLHPFAGLHRQLQGGHFDVADRLFSSVPRTWGMCTGSSAAEVKELTPEWYCNPSFLRNINRFRLGTSQDGDLLGDVTLPPWAKGSPETFVQIMRAALESDICTEMLPDWIDLIFGYKQQGPEAIKANNVYFYLTYYGAVDVSSIQDEALRQATELQIAHFGQCPMQLFHNRPHVHRLELKDENQSFYQLLSSFGLTAHGPNNMLPFESAPLSHWVHLDAPPPGPHAALVAVRLAGTDRLVAVDARGVFHTFRWTWVRNELSGDEDNPDEGCFLAQRELPRFKTLPRLMNTEAWNNSATGSGVAVALSKTLFAGRSVIMVLSDGDSQGGLGIQLLDPSSGNLGKEVLIPHVHSGRITCIAAEPIGTAAGYGGVGGELAILGSADGNASIWRFMSSHYLPLRPRVTMRGHSGAKVHAVALCSPSLMAATISEQSCCLYSISNGFLLRRIPPPAVLPDADTTFADTRALAISVQGYVICVCKSLLLPEKKRAIFSLAILTVEGILVGSVPLEPWRGVPHKMSCIPDGTAVIVCGGRGVAVHRVSAVEPLALIDEWGICEFDADRMLAAYDFDCGPSLNRPVVAACGCPDGALRLHALPGLSAWSLRNGSSLRSGILSTKTLTGAVKGGLGLGRTIAGLGIDLGREVSSDVRERGVGGFLSHVVFGKK